MLVAIALFFYFSLCGIALTALISRQKTDGRFGLGAPSLGVASLMLATLFLNRVFNLPIHAFAPWMFTLTLVGSVAIVAIKRELALSLLRVAWPFLTIALVSIPLNSWPSLQFGLDWLSYANDDMLNYSYSAAWLQAHGFHDVPSKQEFVDGTNLQSLYYILLIAERHGVDEILAFIASITNLNPLRAFMPTIVALNATLVAAASFAAFRSPQLKIAALATAVFVAISPLTTLGTIYQLLGQVGGLSLFALALAYVSEDGALAGTLQWSRIFLSALAIAALTAAYPELDPFLAIVIGAFIAIRITTKTMTLRAAIKPLASLLLISLALLNTYVTTSAAVLLMRAQAQSAPGDGNFRLPYYLIPSGFANLVGAYQVGTTPPEPYLSLGIAIGISISAIVVYFAIRLSFEANVSAITTVLFSVVCLAFFAKRSDFALYKMAMYIQPFAIACACTYIFRTRVPKAQAQA